jgi:hypothetical protein
MIVGSNSRESAMRPLPALTLLAAPLSLLMIACGAPNASTERNSGKAAESDAQLDPETLIDTISHGDEVTLAEHLPDDEAIPTVVLFTADW